MGLPEARFCDTKICLIGCGTKPGYLGLTYRRHLRIRCLRFPWSFTNGGYQAVLVDLPGKSRDIVLGLQGFDGHSLAVKRVCPVKNQKLERKGRTLLSSKSSDSFHHSPHSVRHSLHHISPSVLGTVVPHPSTVPPVEVDPDSVFFPQRLRPILQRHEGGAAPGGAGADPAVKSWTNDGSTGGRTVERPMKAPDVRRSMQVENSTAPWSLGSLDTGDLGVKNLSWSPDILYCILCVHIHISYDIYVAQAV